MKSPIVWDETYAPAYIHSQSRNLVNLFPGCVNANTLSEFLTVVNMYIMYIMYVHMYTVSAFLLFDTRTRVRSYGTYEHPQNRVDYTCAAAGLGRWIFELTWSLVGPHTRM